MPRAKKSPVPPPPVAPTAATLESADNRLLVSAMVLQALCSSERVGPPESVVGAELTKFGRQTVTTALLLADELIRQHHATLAAHRVAPEAGR